MPGRKIFLDCGTHLGQGIEETSKLIRIDDTWEVFTWEANPHTFNKFPVEKFSYLTKLTRFQKAINDFDGSIDLNIHSVEEKNLKDSGMGSSIIDLNEWNEVNNIHEGSFTGTQKIECIDFSKWIQSNCSEEDYIIVKMDIEGAEYQVLEKMIADDTLKYIHFIYIEWHKWVFANQEPYTIREKNILDEMAKQKVHFISKWR